MFEEIVIGGISLGSIITIIKIAIMLYKERKKLILEIKALGMTVTKSSKNYVKKMNAVLKSWIKLMKLRIKQTQDDIIEQLEQTFKSLINNPDAEKMTAEIISRVQEIFKIFKTSIENVKK